MEFDHVAISVNKLEESIKYYTDHFGFVLDGRFEKPLIFLRFAFLKKENFRIELFEFRDKVKGKDDLKDLRIRGLRHLAFKVKDITGFRDRAIHNYFEIDLDIVWNTILQDIPVLAGQLRKSN